MLNDPNRNPLRRAAAAVSATGHEAAAAWEKSKKDQTEIMKGNKVVEAHKKKPDNQRGEKTPKQKQVDGETRTEKDLGVQTPVNPGRW